MLGPALLSTVGIGAVLLPPLSVLDLRALKVPLIGYEGVWNVDVDTELLKILADHPKSASNGPRKRFTAPSKRRNSAKPARLPRWSH